MVVFGRGEHHPIRGLDFLLELPYLCLLTQRDVDPESGQLANFVNFNVGHLLEVLLHELE